LGCTSTLNVRKGVRLGKAQIEHNGSAFTGDNRHWAYIPVMPGWRLERASGTTVNAIYSTNRRI
jgi:hypothetical protein